MPIVSIILLVLAIVFAVLGTIQNSAKYVGISVILLCVLIALGLGGMKI
jgi:hypothetical protein